MKCDNRVGGWEGGGVGGGGGLGAEDGVKHPFGLKGQSCAFSKCHELIQTTREAQTAVRSSLVPHAVLLTRPRTMNCTLVVSQHRQKAVCKSRPGSLLSSAWCFWIVHECAYHVQAKDGFWFLCPNGRFSKMRSQIIQLLHSSKFYSSKSLINPFIKIIILLCQTFALYSIFYVQLASTAMHQCMHASSQL